MLFDTLVGMFLMALGISIILKTFFDIDLPIIRTIIACTLILIGANIVLKTLFYKQIYVTFR
jgi:hypothetical protein